MRKQKQNASEKIATLMDHGKYLESMNGQMRESEDAERKGTKHLLNLMISAKQKTQQTDEFGTAQYKTLTDPIQKIEFLENEINNSLSNPEGILNFLPYMENYTQEVKDIWQSGLVSPEILKPMIINYLSQLQHNIEYQLKNFDIADSQKNAIAESFIRNATGVDKMIKVGNEQQTPNPELKMIKPIINETQEQKALNQTVDPEALREIEKWINEQTEIITKDLDFYHGKEKQEYINAQLKVVERMEEQSAKEPPEVANKLHQFAVDLRKLFMMHQHQPQNESQTSVTPIDAEMHSFPSTDTENNVEPIDDLQVEEVPVRGRIGRPRKWVPPKPQTGYTMKNILSFWNRADNDDLTQASQTVESLPEATYDMSEDGDLILSQEDPQEFHSSASEEPKEEPKEEQKEEPKKKKEKKEKKEKTEKQEEYHSSSGDDDTQKVIDPEKFRFSGQTIQNTNAQSKQIAKDVANIGKSTNYSDPQLIKAKMLMKEDLTKHQKSKIKSYLDRAILSKKKSH